MSRRPKRQRIPRRGTIAVLAVVLLVVFCAVVAFAVDFGYLCAVQSELQRSADAAALAGAAALVDDSRLVGNANEMSTELLDRVRAEAQAYAVANPILARSLALDVNSNNDPHGDIVIGQFLDPADHSEQLKTGEAARFNTVFVTARFDERHGGRLPLYFARVLGNQSAAVSAVSAATVLSGVSGFRVPPDENLSILPIALKKSDWDDLLQ
jgi:hypothetical protein